jgi:hypothetical protein
MIPPIRRWHAMPFAARLLSFWFDQIALECQAGQASRTAHMGLDRPKKQIAAGSG